MSREIKFRIWDKKSGMWLNRFNANLLNIGDLSIVIISQYTGLKDIAGYDIFEGDIVKDVSDGIIGQIEYSDGGFIIIYDDIAEKLSAEESAYLEVVGNIFENPELLGEEVQI